MCLLVYRGEKGNLATISKGTSRLTIVFVSKKD